MIGGSGERKTLRTVARYADMWNGMGPLDTMRHKVEVLRQHCADVGRDPSEIQFTLGIKPTIRDSAQEADRVWKQSMEHNRTPMERVANDTTFWNGTAEQIAERLGAFVEVGFGTVIAELPAPFDRETMERLIGEVKPLVDRA
jgi:alkanesulfonate monooxygenase SsuD/methylene tetrahydromethanopterin reductase-like flavin-dependent oxidoreductase (luciferase family)